ncbi:hypothetical protein ElyMa_002671300 [Elysia marginata]|uniref:BRCT domain-containing protein n=1 Tax=Elysia marginata TaxID=1093978 RepID=A0AAV4H8W4_9GAST|nr:hypothetical protein ElyMa_002671300 [Elysia marginata]
MAEPTDNVVTKAGNAMIFIVPIKFQKRRLEDIKKSLSKKGIQYTDIMSSEVTHVVSECQSLEQVEKYLTKSGQLVSETAIVVSTQWLIDCLKASRIVEIKSSQVLKEVWAYSILLSYGTISSTMMDCCVEGEWITMSSLNAVLLMTSGCLSHSGRSAETSQSLQLFNSPFLWVLAMFDLPHHVLVPPSVVNIVKLGEGGLNCPSAVLITEASS